MGSCFSGPKRPKSKNKSKETYQTPIRREDANKKEPRRPTSVYHVETQTSSRRVVVEKNVCEAKNMPPPFLDNRSKSSINILHKRHKLVTTKAIEENYVEKKMSDNDETSEKKTSSLEEAATMEQEVAESSQSELISFRKEQEQETNDDEESDKETNNGTKRKPEFEEIDKFEASPDRQSDYESDDDESDYIAYRRTKRSAAIKSRGKNAALAEKYPHLRNERQDTIYYRLDPEQTSDNDIELNDNVRFFRMEIPSKPSGDLLKNIWQNWWNDYNKLELHHGYIQWLFPLREQGLNSQSQPLQLHELEKLTKEQRDFEKTKKSLIKSFRMMLGFYGMELNAQTGEIERASNYKQRYANLRNHRHNFLRITRILKCLGDFKLEEYQINWIWFLADEIFVKKALPELNYSMTDYWVHTIKDDEERAKMIDYLEEIIFDNL